MTKGYGKNLLLQAELTPTSPVEITSPIDYLNTYLIT